MCSIVQRVRTAIPSLASLTDPSLILPVKAVLQETEQVLTLCGTKRDGELEGR